MTKGAKRCHARCPQWAIRLDDNGKRCGELKMYARASSNVMLSAKAIAMSCIPCNIAISKELSRETESDALFIVCMFKLGLPIYLHVCHMS